jgi:hypothetical protein
VSEQNLDHELNALAEALTHLKPCPAILDRDTLLFRAGQASAPHSWKWTLAAGVSTLVAVGLGIALLLRPQPPSVVETVYVQVPAPQTPTPEPQPVPPTPETPALVSQEIELPPPQSDYQRLRDHLLRWGFDGLPRAPHETSPKETRDSLLKSL